MSATLPPEVEALVRAHLPRLRTGMCAEVPKALGEQLAQDYPARVERGLLDPARELAAAILLWVWPGESHDVEALWESRGDAC